MQVDGNPETIVYVNTPRGGELSLDPGRQVVARVVAAGGDGAARISLAGQVLDVTTDAPLRVGQDVRLSVSRADEAGVRLAIVTPDAAARSAPASARDASGLVSELARAGVPVNAGLARAAAAIAEQLGGGSAAARAVAALAGRDLALSAGAAGRVSAALDLAGALGPNLSSLAARAPAVAAALPAGAPGAQALRALLAPNLANAELAIARIVQSAQSVGAGAPATVSVPASSSATVIHSYVASQVAGTAQLDELAAAGGLLGGGAALAARAPGAAPGLAPAALQAALRGQAERAAATGDPAQPPLPVVPGATAAAATTARANATAAAASGAAAATATPTSARAAQAIVDLVNLAVRHAPAVAHGAGAMGTAASSAGRGVNAAEVAQQAGRAGAVAAAAASVAGAGAGGDPAPLVAAIQHLLSAPGAGQESARSLAVLSAASPALLATAIRTLPESQALQLAGRLLDALPTGATLAGPALLELRHGIRAALDRLGSGLLPAAAGNDAASLRAVLEHVAAHDPRPSVAGDAARLLAAADGQQILSRTASGADPGYLYFQVPMPDGGGAEVMVRREPGRRTVTFDEFNIAFLLDTQHLGTLMVQLDAHPAGIRADVLTDVPGLEPYLRARTQELIEPLARESRRPVTVTAGVFDAEPPTSLLDPVAGALEPGVHEFYA